MCLVLQACAQSWTTWRALASARPPVDVPAEPGARPRGAEDWDSAESRRMPLPSWGQDDDSGGERDVVRRRESAAERRQRQRRAPWEDRTTHKSERPPAANHRIRSRRCPFVPRRRPPPDPVRRRFLTCGGSLPRPQPRLQHWASASESCRAAVEKTLRSPCLRRAGPSARPVLDRDGWNGVRSRQPHR